MNGTSYVPSINGNSMDIPIFVDEIAIRFMVSCSSKLLTPKNGWLNQSNKRIEIMKIATRFWVRTADPYPDPSCFGDRT